MNIVDKCVFDNHNGGCGALIEKKCEGCKFFKTEQQFDDAQKQAALILDNKELQPKVIRQGATQIMSVSKKYVGRW